MSEDSFGEIKSFEGHFHELKASLKHGFIVFSVLSVFFFLISDQLLIFMQQDIEVSLHGLTPFEVLNVRMSISSILGLVSSLPVIIYSLVSFARPGLKEEEHKILRNSLPFSYILFIAGTIFAYQVIFKSAINFFISYTQGSNIAVLWGLENTLMLGLRISLITGFLFQLPLLILILEKAGIITVQQLKNYRAYVIVAVLIIAAVATPPDLITQILITLPIILLYEISLKIAEHV